MDKRVASEPTGGPDIAEMKAEMADLKATIRSLKITVIAMMILTAVIAVVLVKFG